MQHRVISADSHLEVPVDRWIDRVPAQYRDRAPRRISLPHGGDAHIVEGRPIFINGLNLCGKPYQEYSPLGASYAKTPGTGGPEQRLREQDQDGIAGEVLFPGIGGPNFWRGIGDDNAYRSLLRAYNDFLAEDYCAVAPDRLIGLGLIPETGVDDAVAELEHCAEMGLKGVCLNAFPSARGYPTPEDDRFWAAAADMPIAVTIHIQFGFPARYDGPFFIYPRNPSEMGIAGQDPVRRLANYSVRGGLNAVQLIFAGVFDRFPNLRIYWGETQIGWIPNFLEQLDTTYERNKYWMERLLGVEQLKQRPSEYVREHCWWGFLLNPIGVQARHAIGVDHVMWGSDFPHSESDWPNSAWVLEQNFSSVPKDEVRAMTVDNAVKFFRLPAD